MGEGKPSPNLTIKNFNLNMEINYNEVLCDIEMIVLSDTTESSEKIKRIESMLARIPFDRNNELKAIINETYDYLYSQYDDLMTSSDTNINKSIKNMVELANKLKDAKVHARNAKTTDIECKLDDMLRKLFQKFVGGSFG